MPHFLARREEVAEFVDERTPASRIRESGSRLQNPRIRVDAEHLGLDHEPLARVAGRRADDVRLEL